MHEPIEITVLKLFREFNDPPAVAKYLGMKYSEVIHILTKETINQREVKALVDKDISEWKAPYKHRTYVDKRKIKADKIAKEQKVETRKDTPSITFGYGGNYLLNKDKPMKNNNYYLNESRALL